MLTMIMTSKYKTSVFCVYFITCICVVLGVNISPENITILPPHNQRFSKDGISCFGSNKARLLVANSQMKYFNGVISCDSVLLKEHVGDSELMPPITRALTMSSYNRRIASDHFGKITTCLPNALLDCGDIVYSSGKCSSSNYGRFWKTLSILSGGCPNKHMDVMFVMDGSRSVNVDHPDNFQLAKNWVRDVTKKLGISSTGKVSVGVVQYSHYYAHRLPNDQPNMVTEIKLGEYTNSDDFSKALNDIELQSLTTYTAHALIKTIDDFKESPYYQDPMNKKILILITDGRSNDWYLLKRNADILRSLNITCFAVGVRNAAKHELQIVAGSEKRVFSVNDFNSLPEIVDTLLDQVKQTFLEGTDVGIAVDLRNAQIGFSIAYGQNTSSF